MIVSGIMAASLMLSQNGAAQNKPSPASAVHAQLPADGNDRQVNGFMTTGGDSSVIAGRLTDAETGDPVTFAGVYLEGTALSTFSDMEGYFRLLIPEEADTFTTYTLLVRSVGYEIQRITLDKSDLGKNKQIHLKIKVAEVTLGMMVMDKKALRRQKRKAARDKKQE